MIRILAVGKIKEKANKDLISEYVKRLTPYVKLEITEVDEVTLPKNASDADVEILKFKESEKILSQISPNHHVILLDLDGKNLNSTSFCDYIFKQYVGGNSDITFVIGGSHGVSKVMRNRADFRLKLSDMTFPHQLARLILIEQIYRAYKIHYNEPYHK
ncbi:MAG: 23S rRNA (pseudouridine(1915)-N(3))-methyltransferase RlmH [Erysipelothrix sp.]|nr:23S rRNA (pseudouridine(1915)-N(3))-methyltransferase RlmH [Erysipelothrix sp.]